MSDLPQIHDWFFNLLTGGQWIFIYIIAVIVLLTLSFTHWGLGEQEPDIVGGGCVAMFLVPPLVWLVLLAIGNFISFMIWLWLGGVGG